jgi:hypothetical protein
MMSGETKKCPKCGNDFKCNNHNISNCACMEVPIDPVTRQKIAEKYDDCLCVDCLKLLVAKEKEIERLKGD